MPVFGRKFAACGLSRKKFSFHEKNVKIPIHPTAGQRVSQNSVTPHCRFQPVLKKFDEHIARK